MAGRAGEVAGEPLEKFAGRPPGLGCQHPAEGVIVDGMAKVIALGGLGEGRNGKDGGTENLLRLAALGSGNADAARELQVNEGESCAHNLT